MKRLIILLILTVFTAYKGQTEQKTDTPFTFLNDEVLKTKSKEELKLLRNEVYARKGYIFKSNDLNKYFKSKPWYAPDPNKNINSLTFTSQEKDYVNKIKYHEEGFYNKNEIDASKKCINYLSREKPDFYPLNEKKK